MVTVEPTKRCSRCKQWKPLSAFNNLARAKDGRQYYCRECNATWHAENKERHNASIRRRNERLAREIAERLFEHKLSLGCSDCGERDPTVLEFDHLRDKDASVAALVRYGNWARVEAEVAKCDVVCANCHRRRTAMRSNDLRWRLYVRHQERIARLGVDVPAPCSDRTIAARLEALRVGRLGFEPRTTTA